MRIVVMGPSGSGKSLVGAAVAAALRAEFIDGDDLHPRANIAKMSAGVALTDADRAPWLDAVAAALHRPRIVVACSALRRAYRDRIRAALPAGATLTPLMTLYLTDNLPPQEIERAREAARRLRLVQSALTRHLQRLQRELGLTFVHPFDDPLVLAGQGTIGLELLRQVDGNDFTVFVPVGGGGLIAGVAAVLKALMLMAERPEMSLGASLLSLKRLLAETMAALDQMM